MSPVAAGQEPTIPAGATSQVALPASNILATCTPPGMFHPNPTVWTVNPSTVQLGNLPAGDTVPPAGHLLSVPVPADHSPYQSITISWSGNTDCVSFNGHFTLNVCNPVADPVGCPVGPPAPGPPACPVTSGLHGVRIAQVSQCPADSSSETLTPEQKAALNKLSGLSFVTSGLFGAGAGASCAVGLVPGAQLIGGGACAILAIASGMSGIAGGVFQYIAADPPDPNFRALAAPSRPRTVALRPSRRSARSAVARLNRLTKLQAREASLGNALLHSLERSQGARHAGNTDWQVRQTERAHVFARQLADTLNAELRVRPAVRRALLRAQFPRLVLTARDVARARERIRRRGLPRIVQTTFRRLGANPTTLRRRLLSQSPKALRFPDALTDKAMMTGIRAAARSLRQFANG